MGDPIELEVFKNLFHSIAEEMGAALRRTSFSPNIKERRDYSCAVFDSEGRVIAMGDHMPVHLGSMPMSVAAAVKHCALEPGDVVMLNDPFRGGTHLPDITLVMPVYASRRPTRAHRRHIGSDSVLLRSLSDCHPEQSVKERSNRTRSEGSAVRQPDADPSLVLAAGCGRFGTTIKENWRMSTSPPDFYVASRAHHADVGGTYPGSMGPCREIYQEGLRIPPVRIMRGGKIVEDVMALLLNNVRTPEERDGDLGAQIAACETGARRLAEISGRYGMARVQRAAVDLLDYSEQMMRSFLAGVPAGIYRAEDFLDDDGIDGKPVRITVTLRVHKQPDKVPRRNKPGRAEPVLSNPEHREGESKGVSAPHTAITIDFTGSDPQAPGAVNAVEAITFSACFYVFRCLLREDIPATAGLMRPIQVIAPTGTVVNATPPAAVAGGNVETSQRIVDVLLKALAQAIPGRIPAAASGTMNNLTIGGIDPRTGEPFAYYETIAGGMGARPGKDGVSGVHTHMTNSLNTPGEALEHSYPLRLRRYCFRDGSGGTGRYRGGDGIIREIEVLTDAQVTLLADRRSRGPYGLAGGGDGAPGRTVIIRRDGSEDGLAGKTSVRVRSGERVRIESPGGGGWGSPDRTSEN